MRLKKYLKRLLVAPLAALLLTCTAPLYAATKIMPLGDSITGSPGCWRAYLWEKLLLSNYNNIDMVGTLPAQGCAIAYDGDNEGHGGILATNMANQTQLPAWLSATKPDVVLMHLGTNDVWSSKPTSEILAAFTTLVQQMRASNATMKIVVAKIIPMDSARSCSTCAAGVIALNNALPNWASGLSTAASPITVADIWTNFSAINDTYDGVHPTDAGHKKIADSWYPAVVTALGGTMSSSASSSSRLSSSSRSSVASSRSNISSLSSFSSLSSKAISSSSSAAYCGESCNWYGQSTFPLCVTTTSGFGFENGKSCVARATCLSQAPGYGGVIPGTCGQSSSSIKSSSSSLVSSSLPASSSLSSSSSLYSSSIRSSSSISPVSSSKSSSSSTLASSSKSSSSSSLVSSSSSSTASGATCSYVVSNEWNTGFTAAIRITNKGTTSINSWAVSWSYNDGTVLTNSWNATVTGNNSYSATNLSWNAIIQPGQSVEVGVQGNKGSSTTAQIPIISGSVCQ